MSNISVPFNCAGAYKVKSLDELTIGDRIMLVHTMNHISNPFASAFFETGIFVEHWLRKAFHQPENCLVGAPQFCIKLDRERKWMRGEVRKYDDRFAADYGIKVSNYENRVNYILNLTALEKEGITISTKAGKKVRTPVTSSEYDDYDDYDDEYNKHKYGY